MASSNSESDIRLGGPRDSTKTFEIHYVLKGVKVVALHEAYRMNETEAWVIATLHSGLPSNALPRRLYLSLIQTFAETQGVTNVRWNLCPRQAHN